MKIKINIFLIFFIISLVIAYKDVFAVPFRELNQDFATGCIGCKYYSILYDAISQGGYRVYTGLFNVCMFFLSIILSFQLLQSLFKIVVPDVIQMKTKSIENLDLFWKDLFKKMLRIVFVVTIVFTLKPQDITKWTIDPILNGGISVAREFINYGIKQINDNFVGNKELIQTIQPPNHIPKINLGIIKLPLGIIQNNIEQSNYCKHTKQIEIDAKRYEEIDKQNNLMHSLPISTKLNLMCLIKDIGLLSKRYASLGTYYILHTLKRNQIEHVVKDDKKADEITLDLSNEKKIQPDFENNFNTENNIIDTIITVLFIVWLIGIGITIYNIVKWFILDPLIALVVATAIPFILLMIYFTLGGAIIFITLIYYVSYLTFILVMPFYFIQPMFNLAVILFAFPLIAMAWATGDKSYLNKAINKVVSSSIGIAVLCMVFVIAIILNEVTFYSLYDGTINVSKLNYSYDIANRLQMFNLLIMAVTSLLGVYIISNHSKITALFGGSTSNEIFGFFKDFLKINIKKITNVTKNAIKKNADKK